ncbi:hypothetical protein A2382_04055 [Candidatus Woesebacteria bacterium RIFOXYB1_FULL_38_16]|uniref:N-acetyltransferase domain-containing protein n=1 Tax=Candidatus Woesebacteria bacterium RIFOXYB1_FULL_38_16 TaxID=1802538 RepID=A0A1F8CR00_9BACT|nr:MAG: hypothetical protein A2191_02355 [Candidatus Woesebacteria bacterium RIFOXYA1_FULL_38_9]OGM78712.1 MAG: hypothetical protein A2382_04055 [Candidatus Woesebacteria bacterium RIFOXYB1_FULL_38_16]
MTNKIGTLQVKGSTLSVFLYTPESLSEVEQEKLVAELTPLTGLGFMRFDLEDEKLMQDVQRHIVPVPRLLVIRDESNLPICFVSSEQFVWMDQNCFHLVGIIVHPSYQGTGLSEMALSYELCETRCSVLVFRTQNARMLGLGKKVADIYDFLTHALGQLLYPENLDGIVNKGVYRKEQGGASLYDDVLAFERQAIDSIDWQSGDSLVAAGFVKKEKVANSAKQIKKVS